METYTYVNIFETKGLEYLLLICFLVLFVLFVRYLGGPRPGGARAGGRRLPGSAGADRWRLEAEEGQPDGVVEGTKAVGAPSPPVEVP